MKKLLSLLLLMIVVLGVSGCMKQSSHEESKSSEKAMLNYLEEKYNEKFTTIEYIPAERGFNDSMNQNILIAESAEGVRVDVRDTVGNPGEFADDYLSGYGSKLLEGKIDYSSISNVQHAKTYINLRPKYVTLEDLKQEDFNITNEMVMNFSSIIAVSSPANEEVLQQLYDVYNQVQSFGFEKNVFIVGFGGNEEKADKYVNIFSVYGVQDWEKFDDTLQGVMNITENGLTFEEFKGKYQPVGDS
jgi:hypothetical protein